MSGKDKEQEIEHKLRLHHAFLQAKDLDLPTSPRGKLDKLLTGLFGEYFLSSSLHKCIQVLRAPELCKSPDNETLRHPASEFVCCDRVPAEIPRLKKDLTKSDATGFSKSIKLQ